MGGRRQKGKLMRLMLIACIVAVFFPTPGLAARKNGYSQPRKSYSTPKASRSGPVKVRGHIKKQSGAYVAPHIKTAPNKTKTDNYSTQGNANPYTGKQGTKSPVPDAPR